MATTLKGIIGGGTTFSASPAIAIESVNLDYYAKNNISGYKTIESIPTDNLNYLNSVHPSSMIKSFEGCNKLKSIDLSKLDTSNVTSMKKLFLNCFCLTSIDLSNFNTSKVTDMSNMFAGISGTDDENMEEPDDSLIVTIKGLDKFDTSKVTTMKGMFNSYYLPDDNDEEDYPPAADIYINNLDVSSFDTSNVTDMSEMFDGVYNVNGSIDNVSSIDVSNFDTRKVTDMSFMFGESSNPILSDKFDTSNCESITYAFSQISLNKNSYSIIKKLNLSKCKDITGCLLNSEIPDDNLDLSNWDLRSLKSFGDFFGYYTLNGNRVNLTEDKLILPDNFYTKIYSQIEYLTRPFPRCETNDELKTYMKKMNTKSVKSLSNLYTNYAFYKTNIDTIDMDLLDLSSLTDTSRMFEYSEFVTINMTNMVMSKVDYMYDMFASCNKLVTINGIIDLSGLASINHASNMFKGCKNLKNVKVRLGNYSPSEFETATGISRNQYNIVS